MELERFRHCYDETFPHVYRCAYWLTGVFALSEHIALEVYLSAWHGRQGFPDGAPSLPWLLATARTAAAGVRGWPQTGHAVPLTHSGGSGA